MQHNVMARWVFWAFVVCCMRLNIRAELFENKMHNYMKQPTGPHSNVLIKSTIKSSGSLTTPMY